mmetsp:Transcript_2538/g.7051  ORF Transcript_2538/g.7051 Transcript_2538/m.7051 type:complete len:516 (-) Transcript_2538:95-1642(-)|eukprot:CAMPEP_0198119856 /NCGR_PEP_ID=MMETSP1442-20131203/27264_1 /TAXON_ID= /ORGANISM="Craspedostauros australis, Strain CCMP3328" /LENGTH=515 /DNA_ID=CAMNT_0043778411 /DNA_START=123 /DNA_END=1670 /DNA_ORIENTATION=+
MMVTMRYITLATLALLCSAEDGNSNSNIDSNDGEATPQGSSLSTYGVDVSFPIHQPVSTNYDYLPHNVDPSIPTPTKYQNQPIQPLGDRHNMYVNHLNGCREHYLNDNAGNGFTCDQFEMDRLLMNRRQPQSMVNLTEIGFHKVRAPDHLTELITNFWEANKHSQQKENWGHGNVYANTWDNPTTLVNVDDRRLRGAGMSLKEHIWAAASATLEEWTETELQPCSMYGIRVYHEGNIMLPHVDRLPLVASAIIGVAEDLDEDYPFEMYDHQGWAHNVTVKPGDMLLFESHSVIHGHPFPLKGRYAAYIFLHFEPTGNTFNKDESGHFHLLRGSEGGKKDSKPSSKSSGEKNAADFKNMFNKYHEATKKGHAGPSAATSAGLPPYIQRQSPEEQHWRQRHPTGWKPPTEILPPDAHIAAKQGHLVELEQALRDREGSPDLLTARDQNGWQVLHYSVVGGNPDAVKLLVTNGAEINSRTHGGYGETPLRIAERMFQATHPIVEYLRKSGGLSIAAEL